MIVRLLTLILFLFASALIATAGETNYICVVCGKGPLTGQVWLTKWGPLCDDCYKLENHCSLCGLPIRPGDGSVKTGDGRFICRFDKTNAVLDADAARDLFEDTHENLVALYGGGFKLKYPEVTVKLFDVDYWSEKDREDGLDKFGFASTRKTADGQCTHEVVMLSGQLRDAMSAVAAHEYTHLWINENRPSDRVIDRDTIEAICELSAYELMAQKKLPEMQQWILKNPYTHGKIKTLVAVEREGGTDYILNWVKNGKTETFDDNTERLPPVAPMPAPQIYYAPRVLPRGLKFSGIMMIGDKRQAVINGVALGTGEKETIKLRDKSVEIRCKEIHDDGIVVELDGSPAPVTLTKGKETLLP